jgi:23S rRNA pseudouridine1911/1915/1917 synthase
LSLNNSTLEVPEQCSGMRVDLVLAQLLPDFSRTQLSKWLQMGLITLNQKTYKAKEKVLGGEIIHIQELPQNIDLSHHAEDLPLNIIYEDDDLLIINKPQGLVVHPGAGNPQHTLVNALLHHDKNLNALPRAGIIHRLDKDTTGLLIVAKNLISYTQLTRQMQAREIQRCYIALVYGELISGGTIHTFYGRHPHHRLKMAVCKNGKEAITEFRLREKYNSFTLLNVRLLTGRTHQIRVHMAYNRNPIVGDPLYNPNRCYKTTLSEPLRAALQQFKRQALHAHSLELLHPKTRAILSFTAPIPNDFQELLQVLTKEPRS